VAAAEYRAGAASDTERIKFVPLDFLIGDAASSTEDGTNFLFFV